MFAIVEINNVIFLINVGIQNTAGIFTSFSNINILNATFNNSVLGGFSKIKETSFVYLLTGGTIMVNVGSNVIISNCTIDYNYGLNGGAIYLSRTSNIQASDLNITNW